MIPLARFNNVLNAKLVEFLPILLDNDAEERCGSHEFEFYIWHMFAAFPNSNILKTWFNRNMGDWTAESKEDIDWESSHFENRYVTLIDVEFEFLPGILIQ